MTEDEPEIEQLKRDVKELRRELRMHIQDCPFAEMKCHHEAK